ncbi:MAG: hypothetical protein M5R36_21945 [Deltaproteobacteria bacterium]|nr:hypothetical protein [Deltaproteobacteria bacterium]
MYDQPKRQDEFAVGDTFGDQLVVAIVEADPTKDEEIVIDWTDTGVRKGVTYYYQILTFDEIPNYSNPLLFEATPAP